MRFALHVRTSTVSFTAAVASGTICGFQ